MTWAPKGLSVLLLGTVLPRLGLSGPSLGQVTTVGGQRLTGGHVLGHISQPPGRGPSRPPQPLKRRLGVQVFAALVIKPVADAAHRLRWSVWRRRHQARARTCHYRRQAAWQP